MSLHVVMHQKVVVYMQVKPWDLQFMNALFNSMIDWEARLQTYHGKIKNKDKALQ